MSAPITADLIESLLYEDEGVALDFKREAYPFEGAEEHQKVELLKDVLAFANAWRRSTAYVLIGVEDVPGGRGVVRGVDRHPDDAALQQFVNSKTNRPVDFRYRAREFEGKQVGILEIPVQQRPLYLKSRYNKLAANTVYVRRSSSTDEATLEEVARMGAQPAAEPGPDLTVSFGSAKTDERYQGGLTGVVTSIEMPRTIPDFSRRTALPGGYSLDVGMSNRTYYREFAVYEQARLRLLPAQVLVENSSSTPLIDGKLVLSAPRGGGLLLAEEYPPKPNESMPGLRLRTPLNAPAWSVEERGDKWLASTDVGTVYPGGSSWTEEVLIGGYAPGQYPVEAALFGKNLPEPLRLYTTLTLEVDTVRLALEALLEWAHGGFPPDLT